MVKNLRETAKAYEPQSTHNIAELEAVSLDVLIEERKGKEAQLKKDIEIIKKQDIIEITISLFLILIIVLLTVLILAWLSDKIWIMSELKNQCIADCIKFNEQADGLGRCVC